MTIADTKARVAITIDRGVLKRLDAYCEHVGMTRSQFISYCVVKRLDLEEKRLGSKKSSVAS